MRTRLRCGNQEKSEEAQWRLYDDQPITLTEAEDVFTASVIADI
jgi:hypothetical protein